MHKNRWIAVMMGLVLLVICMIVGLRVVADITINRFSRESIVISQPVQEEDLSNYNGEPLPG